VNVENYLREFVEGEYPRLLNLTASHSTGTYVSPFSADWHLYDDIAIRRRNVLILPCDDGKFLPNFDILESGSIVVAPPAGHPMCRFVGDLGSLQIGTVTLQDQVNEAVLLSAVSGTELENEVFGASPTDMTVPPGSVPSVFQITRDASSNAVVIFSIPQIFYGSSIKPRSVMIRDVSVTGSGGGLSFTLRDDGHGNMYRANASSSHASWNSVGNVFYDEGVILVKTPLMPHFGVDSFELSFAGTHKTHVSRFNMLAPAAAVNSSSNSSFQDMRPSVNANDADEDFVYITGINVHDENLNVVMRCNMAQPVIKRPSDRIVFRVKHDW
jgi:hypothetical protein